jgi:hypothetical protein
VPLADVLSGQYTPGRERDDDGDGVSDRWVGGDPAVGKFMELRVQTYNGIDRSMDPSLYTTGKLKMVPLKLNRDLKSDDAKLRTAVARSFVFGHGGGTDEQPWTVKVDGGKAYSADTRRISAAPRLSTGPTDGGTVQKDAPYEVWQMQLQGGWDHPIHVHFEEGIIVVAARSLRSGKSGPARTSSASARTLMRPTAWKWLTSSANSPVPLSNTAMPRSTRTTPC